MAATEDVVDTVVTTIAVSLPDHRERGGSEIVSHTILYILTGGYGGGRGGGEY